MNSSKKLILILFIFVIPFLSNVEANVEERRRALLDIIDGELEEITRLNRQMEGRDPNLLLRAAELYLEKARLIRDEEHERFLTLSWKEKQKINEKRFYKRSYQYFIKAQKTCYYILKRFKRFKKKGNVYYILAFNAKEYQQSKKASKLFKKAIKYSNKNSYTAIKSKLALAEIYYEKRLYRKAIPLYSSALKNRNQKWWTKDAYNLAWCYFRVRKKRKAISLMTEVYRLSDNAKYIDMSDLVERDLAYFYSESGNIQRAVKFYGKAGKDISKSLLKVGRYLKGQGKFTTAQRSLIEAQRYAKDNQTKRDIDLELLSLYEKFGKTKKHLATSKRLLQVYRKGNLDEKGIEDLRYHVSKMSVLLQKQVVDKRYRKQKKIRNQKARYAVEYFNIQSELNKKDNYKAQFHAAETQYAVKRFNQAVRLYESAYDGALKAGDRKIAKLALNGMLASLGRKGISKKIKGQYLTKAYHLYLSKSPKDKKAFKIYQRLFALHMEKGEIYKAEEVLLIFKDYFPKALIIQEAMLARIIDFYRKKKDKAGIRKWVGKINDREFKVTKGVAKQLQLLLLNMQFENVEKFNTKGKKVLALKGYRQIYQSDGSSKKAKENAAYNIAILYYEIDNIDQSYKWGLRALELMNIRDVMNYQNSFLLISSNLFNQRAYQKASDMFEKILIKLCKTKSKNKSVFFKNSIILRLAEGDLDKAKNVIQRGRKCGVSSSYLRDAQLDYLKELAKSRRWESYELALGKLESDPKAWPDLIFLNHLLSRAYSYSGRVEMARNVNNKIIRFYKKSKAKRLPIPLEGLDVIAEIKLKDLRRTFTSLKGVRLVYPENKFNARLKKKFKLLDEVINRVLNIFKIGSGKGVVEGYDILISSHQELANEINGFNPPNKSSSYISSFRKSMNQITKSISNKARDYKIEARRKIVESSILSPLNYKFLGKNPLPIQPDFLPRKRGFLMDRGGRR